MTKQQKVAFALFVAVVICALSYSAGYTFGKDTAVMDNAAAETE